MIYTNKNRLLALTLILLSCTYSVLAQYTNSKVVAKGFKTSKNSMVEITNRYGDINLETWEKDSVSVEIKVNVTENTMGKLHDKLRSINFNLTQSGQFIIINAFVGGDKNILINEFNRLKENIGVGDSKTEIHMQVRMPSNLNLRLNNKFGNIYMNDYHGDASIDMSNGKLIAQNLKGFTNLKISFGDAMIQSVEGANLEVNFGKLNLEKGQRVRLTSKTSDLTLTEVDQLNLSSSRDSYRIRIANEIDADANWTDFNITELNKKGSFRMSYGLISVEKIMPTIERLYIDSRSTKINLFTDSQNDLVFDILSNKELRLPMETKIDSKEILVKEDKTTRYKGRTGNNTGNRTEPNLFIKSLSGDINLMKR